MSIYTFKFVKFNLNDEIDQFQMERVIFLDRFRHFDQVCGNMLRGCFFFFFFFFAFLDLILGRRKYHEIHFHTSK
jgi:hypothetical protein